jgi:hypothetical protein
VSKKRLGVIALVTALSTYIWLVIVVLEKVVGDVEVDTMQQALSYVSSGGGLYTLNYANATVITLAATMLYAGLYFYLREDMPLWSLLGVIFVPVYCGLNLFCYLSQITIIPRLLLLAELTEYGSAAELLTALFVQLWPNSITALLNSLAYALLGIPSIIFGIGMLRKGRMMQIAGMLIALNGAAAIIGFLGMLIGSEMIGAGTFFSGILFSIGLIPLTIALFQKDNFEPRSS